MQAEIEAKGREILDGMRGETPSVFDPRHLTGRLMEWAMRDPALKTQLFRFVDVLPSLDSAKEIAQHALEYLADATGGLPVPAKWVIEHSPQFPWPTAVAARRCVEQMAGMFIVAPTAREAIPVLRNARRRPIAFTVDILGETAVSENEAEQYQSRYLDLIETLAAEAKQWPKVDQIDSTPRGSIPTVNVSVKISALNSQIHPADPEGALSRLTERLRPLLVRAKELGVFVNFDMEHRALKDLTLALFKRALEDPPLEDYPHAGLALQAYLRDSERALDDLIQWARERHRRITVRLIKGAYWDYETVMAGQKGWPVPVFERKAETDVNYERLARRLLENEPFVSGAFGTHNVRSIAACIVHAEALGLPQRSYEFQMLYGMAEPIKQTLLKMGFRVRDYCPIGETLSGMSYLVRRLLENTSNEGFLRAAFSEHTSPETLLRDPAEPAPSPAASGVRLESAAVRTAPHRKSESPGALRFHNEPHTDFTVAANRQRMAGALSKVRSELGGVFPLRIGSKEIRTDREIVSVNPARPDEIVGRVAQAGEAEAELAVACARNAFLQWSRTRADERAEILEHAAESMCRQRFELAALEVFETGKNWTESDADVAEAIDFCRFYAAEMRRLAPVAFDVPGETNVHHYIPRGIAVVIAPWNFPLAILCGMTTAALVTGNCVIVKPSEQSSVIAARFVQLLIEAGVPDGVVNFVPGPGRVVGEFLVNHPQVDLIAFTGSREVGLKIYEAAGRTRPGQAQLKKVVCEMGGKNAVIIDTDAHLDEAIPGIVHSAFGYQGQKCSALSRLIVLAGNHECVVRRLVDAARSIRVGLPEHPGTVVGPVIDRAALARIREYLELGKREATLAFQGAVPEGDGFWVPPTIFTGVSPKSRLAREEIFGPVLCVLEARDLDQALAWANESEFALTGGFYSRSPANIARVKAEMQVGNLYINRGITGALVGRHPFGGFKMSGGGTKAGGRDYLLHFLFPRVVTENRLRRGFAPDEPDDTDFIAQAHD